MSPAYPYPAHHIDQHAGYAPQTVERSIQALANYLQRPAKNDYEKARSIFCWITNNIAYDTQGFFSGRYRPTDSQSVLQNKTSVCDGYASLFESLAQACGLTVTKISGYSKGYNYTIGSSFQSTNHAWNAIQLDRQWYLLDATWGAGYIDNNAQFVRERSDYYFLTPPRDFIYDHLPADPKWQLFTPPISMQQYLQLVYLRPAAFHYGVRVSSHPQNIIRMGRPTTVELLVPPDVVLSARLERNNQKLDESTTFAQHGMGKCTIHIAPPAPGNYTLRIYAKRRREATSYQWALDYSVEAQQGNPNAPAYPKTFGAFNERQASLHTPMEGRLQAGRTYRFKLAIPGAEAAAVILNNQWHHLQKRGDAFEGDVSLTGRGDAGVFAKFPPNQQYDALLQYTVS